MKDIELEKLEKEYLYFISKFLSLDCNSIVQELNNTNLNKQGVDLFFYYLFRNIFKHPISPLPDIRLNFELPDAFMHIEVKTASVSNPADSKGKIKLGINQTSYQGKGFRPNLPVYYQRKNLVLHIAF